MRRAAIIKAQPSAVVQAIFLRYAGFAPGSCVDRRSVVRHWPRGWDGVPLVGVAKALLVGVVAVGAAAGVKGWVPWPAAAAIEILV